MICVNLLLVIVLILFSSQNSVFDARSLRRVRRDFNEEWLRKYAQAYAGTVSVVNCVNVSFYV
jgi:hypothetical protein